MSAPVFVTGLIGRRRERQRMWFLPAAALAVAGAVALAATATWHPVANTLPMTALGISFGDNYPVLRGAVNEHLGAIAAHSTYQFDFAGVTDDSPALVTTPVVFEYDGGPGATFRLPPGRFVAIGHSAGWVYDYTVAVQLEGAALEAAYTTATAANAAISAAPRWRRINGPLPSLDSLRAAAGGTGWRGAGLGRWRLGTIDLLLNLQRGEAPNTYITEVRIFDDAHRHQYNDRMYAIRQAHRPGADETPLPLAAVLNDPTPVPPPRAQRTSAP